MEIPAKVKELGVEKIIFGPAALLAQGVPVKIELSYGVLQERTAYVLNAIAVHDDLLAACREAIDFIWAEMKENPDKEDMDGSIMDRLIELQTGLISVWRKARGGE